MSKNTKITTETLRKLHACVDEVAIYNDKCGGGGHDVTLERCQTAANAGMNLSWAASKLFSEAVHAIYKATVEPVWYELIEKREEYRKQMLIDQLSMSVASADNKYIKNVSPYEKKYIDTMAKAFFDGLVADETIITGNETEEELNIINNKIEAELKKQLDDGKASMKKLVKETLIDIEKEKEGKK